MFYSYVSNSKPVALLFVASGLASYVLGAESLTTFFMWGCETQTSKPPPVFSDQYLRFSIP